MYVYKRSVYPSGEFFFDLLAGLMIVDPRQLNRKYARGRGPPAIKNKLFSEGFEITKNKNTNKKIIRRDNKSIPDRTKTAEYYSNALLSP